MNVTVTGQLTTSQIMAYFDELSMQDIKAPYIEVVDLNGATDLILQYSAIKNMDIVTENIQKSGHLVTLICAYNKVSQEIASMMKPLLQNIKITVHICHTKEEFEHLKQKFETMLTQ